MIYTPSRSCMISLRDDIVLRTVIYAQARVGDALMLRAVSYRVREQRRVDMESEPYEEP